MKVYLAARCSRHPEMRTYAAQLRALGCEVTSRWIEGDHEIDDTAYHDETPDAQRMRFAREDLQDLERATVVISFTEEPGAATRGRGGRHVEFGLAMALGKRMVLVGPRENVFHWLPSVLCFGSWQDMIAEIEQRSDKRT